MNRKRMPLVLTLAALLLLASLGWLVPVSRNGQAAPAPSSDAVFKGKLLMVQTTNMMMPYFLLEKAQMQKIGDHSFLAGKDLALDGGNVGTFKGRTVRVQMEHIISITEFDNLKDLEKAAVPVEGAPAGVVPATPTPRRLQLDQRFPVPPGKQ